MKLLSFLALALVTTNCAHTFKVPPSFGFFSRQCIQQRTVICLVDEDMSAEQCLASVVPAIKAINDAVGRDLYVFKGAQPTPNKAEINALLDSGIYIIGGDSHMPENALGMTGIKGQDDAHPDCITRVYTLISPSAWVAPYGAVAVAIVTHEMIHALGGGHGSTGSSYKTIMTPAVMSPGWADHLSAFDIAALRAMY